MIVNVKPGEFIKVTAPKHPLKDEVLEVLEVCKGEITAHHEGMGPVSLKFHEVGLFPKPKTSTAPINFNNIVAKIQTLIGRYEALNGPVNLNFLEQILGKETLEQILSKPGISTKNNICSKKLQGDICSKNIEEMNGDICDRILEKHGGRPNGKRNFKPASGWLDSYQNIKTGITNYYYCRDEYKRRTKKTRISSGQASVVKEMIENGYPSSQIEKLIGKEDVDF